MGPGRNETGIFQNPPAPGLAGATRLGGKACPITYHQSLILSFSNIQSAIDQSLPVFNDQPATVQSVD